MTIITINDAGQKRKAIYFSELPNGDDLQELVAILTENNPASSELLSPVVPGSIPDTMGAKNTILLAFEISPPRGIYGAGDWVDNILDKAMPEGMGAALTQPAMFDRKNVKTDTWVYVIVVSAMDRDKTSITGAFISDPHDNEAPTLIYR